MAMLAVVRPRSTKLLVKAGKFVCDMMYHPAVVPANAIAPVSARRIRVWRTVSASLLKGTVGSTFAAGLELIASLLHMPRTALVSLVR